MAATTELTRQLPSTRSSELSEEDETADAVARTLHQTTSGIFIDTGKKVALTTQRKIPMPKIFRTKSSDNIAAKWTCDQCRYDNVEDGNPICFLCGAVHAQSAATNAVVHPPAHVSSASMIVPINPFDEIIMENSFNKLQTDACTKTEQTPKMRRGHSFDDSWFTQTSRPRSHSSDDDSHSLPGDDEILPAKKPPRRRIKSAENPLPMFQSPDDLPPLPIIMTTRLNGNGASISTRSKPTRNGKR